MNPLQFVQKSRHCGRGRPGDRGKNIAVWNTHPEMVFCMLIKIK